MNKALKVISVTVLVLIIIAALIAVPNIYLYAIGKEVQTGTAVGYEWSAETPYEEQKTVKVEAENADFIRGKEGKAR